MTKIEVDLHDFVILDERNKQLLRRKTNLDHCLMCSFFLIKSRIADYNYVLKIKALFYNEVFLLLFVIVKLLNICITYT